MATLYFNGAVDDQWTTLGNWWMNDSFSIPATGLPSSSDSVVVNDVNITASSQTVANFTCVEAAILTGTLTVTGMATFNNVSYISQGVLYGNVTFNGASSIFDTVTINGNATFNDTSFNAGDSIINGNATFNDYSINDAIINVDAVFNDTSLNGLAGLVYGNATFNDRSYNKCNIQGNVTVNRKLLGIGRSNVLGLPYKAYQTALLLHFEGSNNSTNFIDSSTYNHSISFAGNAKISTNQSKFGGSSLYIPSTGGRLLVNWNPVFDLGREDFTIEMWYYPISLVQNTQLLAFTNDGECSGQLILRLTGSEELPKTLRLGRTCNYDILTTQHTMSTGQWHHIAATKSNNTVRLFQNGSLLGSQFSMASFVVGSKIMIGESSSLTQNNGDTIDGYIDELRILIGKAEYTSNFTPPSEPFGN